MKRLVLELSDEEHRIIKTKVASEGISIKKYLFDLVKTDLKQKKSTCS